MWKTFFKIVSSSVSELCFPSICLSCGKKTEQTILCSFCSEKIELVSTKNRCHNCFEEIDGSLHRCIVNQKASRAFVCEAFGPARLLAQKQAFSEKIQKNIGSLMVVQLCSLSWPMPDILIPLACKEAESMKIAKYMTAFVSAEIKPVIRKSLKGDSEMCYSLKSRVNLSDKNCLIVSTFPLETKEIDQIALILQEAAPRGVFFLSFLF